MAVTRAGAVLGRFVALAGTCLITAALAAPAERAQIVGIQGKGEYRPQKDLSWSAARVNQALHALDFVRTLGLSRMQIRFWNGVTQTLDHDGEMQVLDEDAAKSAKCTVMQSRSRSWGVARTPPEGFSVCTPSATAAIRGTEWEIDVDDNGAATLSVFNGQVEFYNDQGRVSVGPQEQARAERGKAPVKLFLRVTRERVQWVNGFTVDTSRYPGLDRIASLSGIAQEIRDGRLADAYERLRTLVGANGAVAEAYLLLADFETYRGDLAAAERVLAQGESRFPRDERFEAWRARTALFAGDIPAAYRHADAALAAKPDSVEALLVRAQIDQHEGRANEAIAGYTRAAQLAPADARPYYGRGVVETEREDVRRARADLALAIERDPSEAAYRAQLGTVEGFGGNLGRARAELEQALAAQPSDYVALTGLGIVQLKGGDTEGAIASFQRAIAIEPRYARAHLYAAAAYYQERRDHDAEVELGRAAELDPNDPLPHLLLSMIYLDRIQPGDAVNEAEAALVRTPFLKSLNGVADNQKGVANFGSPLAFMGLEEWARTAAHDSYLPLWGASHLFLADRYPGEFDRRSELMQGFITDPLAFGASNRFSTLFAQPGNHVTASMLYSHSDDLDVKQPTLTVNGLAASPFPISYFGEAIDTRVDPGNSALDIHAHSYTAALGARPRYDWSTFIYANRFDIDALIGQPGVPGTFQHIEGVISRVDAGVRFAPYADSSFWLKAGGSRQHSTVGESDRIEGSGITLVQQSDFSFEPREEDLLFRYTLERPVAVDLGVEGARVRQSNFLAQDTRFHFTDTPVDTQSLLQNVRDRSTGAYADVRTNAGPLHLEAGAGWRRYRKDRDLDFVIAGSPSNAQEGLHRDRFEPFLGAVWHLDDRATLRAACRRWLRPASLETLAPVAVAGMPIDDQLVLAGGTLDQCRLQGEWKPTSRMFVAARAERSRVRNLWSPLDGVQNGAADVSDLERLRNRVLTPPPIPDQLEDTPVYAAGRADRATLAWEGVITPRLGLRAYYAYTDSTNDGPFAPGRHIPYLPRHEAQLGGTWAPINHTFLTVQAIYRTERFADEANTSPILPGWDMALRLFLETPDKHWSVEATAVNLLKKQASDVFGIVVSYRY